MFCLVILVQCTVQFSRLHFAQMNNFFYEKCRFNEQNYINYNLHSTMKNSKRRRTAPELRRRRRNTIGFVLIVRRRRRQLLVAREYFFQLMILTQVLGACFVVVLSKWTFLFAVRLLYGVCMCLTIRFTYLNCVSCILLSLCKVFAVLEKFVSAMLLWRPIVKLL